MRNHHEWQTPPVAGSHAHGFVISREQDIERRTHFFENFPKKLINVSVINAIDGSDPDFDPAAYGELYRECWKGSSNVPHGDFAISLSHALAWQRIINENLPRAFIFEDDAIISPRIQDAIDEWPDNFDLFFVNHRIDTWTYGIKGGRLSPRADPNQTFTKWVLKKIVGKAVDTSNIEEKRQRKAISVRDAARNVIKRRFRPGKDVAYAGGEGYGITHAGAERLSQYMYNIGAIMEIDSFLISASVGQADLHDVDETCATPFRLMKLFCAEEPVLSAAISGNPCVKAVPKRVGGSVKRLPVRKTHP
jgi:GR25 family glycosyltransferase involved in LPS biosynthesis